MKTKPELEPGKRTILFIGAHPDDPEVNACGLAILFRQKGDSVYIASVTDGCSGCMQADPITTAARRKTEAENSADIIGATSLCLNEKDGYL